MSASCAIAVQSTQTSLEGFIEHRLVTVQKRKKAPLRVLFQPYKALLMLTYVSITLELVTDTNVNQTNCCAVRYWFECC